MKGVIGSWSSSSSSENYIPLTPISFLERAADGFGDETSIVDYANNSVSFSWSQTHLRCLHLASALLHLGISRHDVVAAVAPNIPALYELHFGVPMAGAVLCALNYTLDHTTLAEIFLKLHPIFIFVDHQFLDLVLEALHSLTQNLNHHGQPPPTLVLIPPNEQSPPPSSSSNNLPPGTFNYTQLLELAPPHGHDHHRKFEIARRPNDERDPISVNYTSGSTGNPKGVVYSHRAVYLNSMANIINMGMTSRTATRQATVFLWTVDMFRCNGWCLPWAMAAIGGTNVCLRNNDISAEVIFEAITLHKVTHLCGKPLLLSILARASEDKTRKPLSPRVEFVVAGTLPCDHVLEKVTKLGFNISNGYGMTEALGPTIIDPWIPNDDVTTTTKRRRLRSSVITMEGFDVKDSKTMESVPKDGKTVGEIMLRGNTLMSGYVENPKAFKDGWYRTGDVGVRHPDGYVEMKDRAVDVVIGKGGHVVSSLEVEAVLLCHPRVSEAAVVGRRLCKNDEQSSSSTICAFVKLKENTSSSSSTSTSSQEIIEFCQESLPSYMVPNLVIFGDLPVNPTGKVQKFVLRDKVNNSSNGSSVS